ncbi:hypothetical protein KC318_g14656 [Hortaea werneckii]|uniref:Uncharacterized protein n=1 Tax=Hortaea werneckii TaxID=91943 RepID=A0A3M7AV30_HORWE|nr:hypothetical protein KC334_g14814 [Hortaea werneckii]KAI6947831.1 hypothetical protein KC355_g14782 [Hortaea werneckii]KAI7652823.1 hypothetical protein KC318_g14656 [Hortaea werneckii]RMY31268.1 hypothetical protein D0866_07414 [Hortaea werneckii]
MEITAADALAPRACYPPTPDSSPTKPTAALLSGPSVGDGFTSQEKSDALKPDFAQPWVPPADYEECQIRELHPGPQAVTFMGRVANIFDIANTPKTARSAKGCVKLCIKDETGAITVRVWFASQIPVIRLGLLVSIWSNHVSDGENGTLSSTGAPLFVSLFPERDRNCHFMVHENSDDGKLCAKPLGYRTGHPLAGLMTLQNFIDGGCDVAGAKILVVVKATGPKKTFTRKDNSTTESISVRIHDDTAHAILGLWGTNANSPLRQVPRDSNTSNPEAIRSREGWKAGETILLVQSASCKPGHTPYLSLSSASMVDVNPTFPDADWLRHWALRQRSRESVNPPFPAKTFDLQTLKYGPVRCLYTIAELDDFARVAPTKTFQGYLSVLITEMKILEVWERQMLFFGECCSTPVYANATSVQCSNCEEFVELRLNPKVVGQVMDETACVGAGKLLFSDQAWQDLFGRKPEDLLKLSNEEMKFLSDRLLFCRITLLFGWTGDESKAGGRICVLGVQS